MSAQTGARTALAIPLLREDTRSEFCTIWRDVVEPFNDRQIELVKTFADQAVVAIENVRLFQELKESLEQQTATSEILGVIASSPTDIQPVLDAVAENAARLCEATDAQIRLVVGDVTRLKASFGTLWAPETRPIIRKASRVERSLRERLCTFLIFRCARMNFLRARACTGEYGHFLVRQCSEKGLRSESSVLGERRFVLSPSDKLNCSKLSLLKR